MDQKNTIRSFFLTGFLLLIVSADGFSQASAYQHVETADVDSIFSEFKADMPGCAVGVSDRGNLIFAKGYGSANLDYQIPIEPDSRFMIASISKQFAAASLLMLEQEGKLDLDEDLRTYIPELPEFEEPITARQVMHHTSGLRDMFILLILADIGLDNTTTPEQTLELIGRQKRLNFKPNSQYTYNNTGFFLISVLVEKITGKTLREYADEHFFQPIGMASTHFHDDTGMVVPNRAESYRSISNGYGRFYRDNLDRVGARGLFTTIEDMALWDGNFIENKSHLDNFTEKMTEAGVTVNGDTLDYAAGLRISRYKMLETVGHGGSYMGFKTNYMQFPEQQLGIIVFCNLSSINPATYARQVADLYLKDPFEEQLKQYSGLFRNEKMNVLYNIILEDGDLYLKRGINQKHRMIWRDDDEFTVQGRQVNFRRNEQGDLEKLDIKSTRISPVTFEKVSEL